METKKRKGKVYTDKDGREIPSGYIHKVDKEKHAAALRIHKKAVDLNSRLVAFKAEVFEVADALYQRMLDEKKIELRDNSRGGYSISTIDKAIKVEITVAETIAFDERIDVAQKLINEYLEDKTKGADQDLAILVNEAFRTTRGRLDTRRIINLMKLKITNEKWAKAVDLIKESMSTSDSKRYIRVWERDQNGGYKPVKLDFAAI